MSKTLLILGNGFDLDLGLETSYKNFYDSDNWPFLKEDSESPLANHLYKKFKNGWFDLEDAMGEYFQQNLGIELASSQVEFEGISIALMKYLEKVQKDGIKTGSYGAALLTAVCESKCENKIYSFNYTDIKTFAEQMDIKGDCETIHVHGSLKDKNIILGVGDYTKLPKENMFAYKTFNPRYKSTFLAKDLQSFDNIIIFGHSISKIDYPYFQRFFNDIAKGSLENKYVRILTFDEKSKSEIKSNIREMEENLVSIYNSCDFDILTTCNHDNVNEFKEMIKRINPNMRILAYSVEEICDLGQICSTTVIDYLFENA